MYESDPMTFAGAGAVVSGSGMAPRRARLARLLFFIAMALVALLAASDHASALQERQVSCQRGQGVTGLLSTGTGSVAAEATGIDFVTFEPVHTWAGSTCGEPLCLFAYGVAGNPDVAWEVIDIYADTEVSWVYLQCSGTGRSASQQNAPASASDLSSTLVRRQ